MKKAYRQFRVVAVAAVVAALVGCGGGGGGGGSGVTAVLAPGIWNKTDNSTSATKFVGVVTTGSGGNGEVWALTAANQTSKSLFIGTVSPSGEVFETRQGDVFEYANGAFTKASSPRTLTLPKSASSTAQVFDFGSGISYSTVQDLNWPATASFSANDWNARWTLTEVVSLNGVNTEVVSTWNVSDQGVITGTKAIAGQPPCTIDQSQSRVTLREKAVVNVSVKYDCPGSQPTSYSGISFPEVVSSGRVTDRTVWMRRIDSNTNEFVTQVFTRAAP